MEKVEKAKTLPFCYIGTWNGVRKKGGKRLYVGYGGGRGRGREGGNFYCLCWKVQVSRDEEAHDKVDNLIIIIRVLNWSELIHNNVSLLTL